MDKLNFELSVASTRRTGRGRVVVPQEVRIPAVSAAPARAMLMQPTGYRICIPNEQSRYNRCAEFLIIDSVCAGIGASIAIILPIGTCEARAEINKSEHRNAVHHFVHTPQESVLRRRRERRR
ncbi:hypothetical protein EVAR_33443_1 [Eumeta japonica]|uniref:Uncharacterized protein n=1 Tax=Eumeta variegata TaxID=151549 RepID=A0A4C1W4B4_EUMVA|nr:hypothetical protein EVAR_33443_1 [Eumeta japonica]